MKRYPFKNNSVLVSGHRGLSCYGFENTMTAFRMAINAGVDMIETDVRMTKDGHLVLHHDPTFERTAKVNSKISDMAIQEIKGLNVHINSTIDVPPEAPPKLEEFLDLLYEYPNVLLNIELKDYPEDYGEKAFLCADKICKTLLEYKVENRTFINSFSGKLLDYVYKNYKDTFYYHGFYPWFILGDMETDPESFISVACMQHRIRLADGTIQKCADNMCPKEWFDYLLSKGIMPLMAPSLKEYHLYDLAFSYGSRIVNTDNPEEMIEHLKVRGYKK